MNRELLALVEALAAAKEASGEASRAPRLLYESRLVEILQRHPHLSRPALERAIDLAYERWLRAQKNPPTIPPTA
jgi:hypothetical protein